VEYLPADGAANAARLVALAAETRADLLVNVDARRGSAGIYKSSVLITPTGPDGRYDKTRLVPFGEYVPFGDVLPMRKVTPGSIDLSAGPGPRTLTLPGLPAMSPIICYEAIFPGRVVDRNMRPAWIFNVTNDAWYGRSSAPYQHFAQAGMRAIEQGRYLARAANTGISGVIDPYGREVEASQMFEPAVLVDDVRFLSERTVYAQIGDLFAYLCTAVTAAAFLASRRSRKSEPRNP
jgi:apolipoprotein N-acyltransferase